jgi:EmrB/QacA subfamily drug resistance transporter
VSHTSRSAPARSVDRSAPHRPGLLLAVVCAAIFFDALDLSITQIALPSIQAGLDLDARTLPWVATGYVTSYGGFLLLGGRAADLLGARRIFLVGLAVFGAASLCCGLAPSAGTLIVARAVQGVGAALTVPAAISLLATTFPAGPTRTRAFAYYAAAASTGFAAGLVFGGLITTGLSWRWIFLAKVPLVLAVLLLAGRAAPDTPTRPGPRAYDVTGAVCVTAASTLLIFGITRAGGGATAWTVVVPLVLAGVLLVAFVGVERRSRAPLLPLRLLRMRTATASNAAALTVLAAPFGVSYVVTLYLQDALRRSALETALTLLTGAVVSALVGLTLAPRLITRFGLKPVYVTALLVVAAGNALLILLTASNATWLVIVATTVSFGFGMGTAYPAATVGGITDIPAEDQGTAAGLNNTALQVGGGVGLAVVAAAVAGHLDASSVAGVSPAAALGAAHAGAVAAALVPLCGALVALFGIPGRRR